MSRNDTLRRYALVGVAVLLHIAVFLALRQMIIFKPPDVADDFGRVQIPKPVETLPPPPSEPQPSPMPPSANMTPPEPVAAPQVVPAFTPPAVTMPQVEATRLPTPSLPVANPTPSAGNGLTGTEGQGAATGATGDIGQLGNGLKGSTPADTLGGVSYSQATMDTESVVDKIEASYPNVSWGITSDRADAANQSSIKRDSAGRVNIRDNLQLLCSGDPTAVTLKSMIVGINQHHPKKVVMILDLTDPGDRNEQFAKDLVKFLRDKSIRLFIIPMSVNGADIAIHGPVYQCLSSYVTESGGVIYFPAGVPRDLDTADQQP